jgi:hypothetical protein
MMAGIIIKTRVFEVAVLGLVSSVIMALVV